METQERPEIAVIESAVVKGNRYVFAIERVGLTLWGLSRN